MNTKKGRKRVRTQPSLSAAEHFSAENLQTLISIISASAGLTTATIKAISYWIEDRKSRKIRISYNGLEVELSGPIAKEKIEEVLQVFANFHQERIDAERVKIITSP